jgi:WD40 repeat protein
LVIPKAVLHALAVSPSGKLVAVSGYDVDIGASFLHVYDLETGKAVRLFPRVSKHPISLLAFSRDGARLVSSEGDASSGEPIIYVTFWDINRGEAGKSFSLKGQPFFLSQDALLARHWSDKKICVCVDLKTERHTLLRGHTSAIESGSVSPDDLFVCTAEASGPVRVWEKATGKLKFCLELEERRRPRFLCFLQKEALLLLTTPFMEGYDLRSGKQTERVVEVSPQAVSADGKLIATTTPIYSLGEGHVKVWRGGIHIWSRKKKTVLGTLKLPRESPVRHMVFTPDGRYLVATGGGGIIRIWDVSKL